MNDGRRSSSGPGQPALGRKGSGVRGKWRRPGRALWHWSAGRDAAGGLRPTGRFLFSRMVMLPALMVTVLALAGTAYFDVHRRTEELRDRYAPALVDLAHARVSLVLAQQEAEQRLGTGDEAPLPQTALVGLGERYPALVTKASQSLNNAVQTGALSRAQEQVVRVVAGLVSAYDGWIDWAGSHHDSAPLRRAGMDYAADLLRTGPTSVLRRIGALEADLRAAVADRADRHMVLTVAASVALPATLVLLFVFAGLLDFVRAGLRVRSPLLMLSALPVLLVLAVLSCGVAAQQRAQRDVQRSVSRIGEITVPRPPADDTQRADTPRGPDAAIERADAALAERLRDTHPDGWARTSALALAAGAAGAVGCGLTLRRYGREHWKIDWGKA
ncbi:membrane protein [Streptomyces chrestomyceticus JCM 4735]|uniref:Membrane protein n=1 Tax=Streptomyces chrestomyceticus JCM 4735 TaxID=1306181 RepID=A0A7U9L3W8_9ACTN|nr:hypothetical protein [Streptomyces chrestomyceticus]GCD39947.1 membrane protein [Streptomyces chrestomyceticus JCM 4735]